MSLWSLDVMGAYNLEVTTDLEVYTAHFGIM